MAEEIHKYLIFGELTIVSKGVVRGEINGCFKRVEWIGVSETECGVYPVHWQVGTCERKVSGNSARTQFFSPSSH
jgi:hypothetical protein